MTYKIKKVDDLYLKRYNVEKKEFSKMFDTITPYGWECFNRKFDKRFDEDQRKILKLHK